MKHDPIASGKRKSVNLTMDTGIVAAAREAGINLSQVSEAAVREDISDARWKEENRDWIEQNNRWIEENSLPLEKYRLF
ncbi:MAG: type II toxin-antitoxin system CcdA family antitoxin [Sphingomonas bacterium]|nr:type II toxin-antitoxin system CcdA family antitoxin [Sphingomonas bacterium]